MASALSALKCSSIIGVILPQRPAEGAPGRPVEGNRPASMPGSPFGAAETKLPTSRLVPLINNLGLSIPFEAYCAAEPPIEGEEAKRHPPGSPRPSRSGDQVPGPWPSSGDPKMTAPSLLLQNQKRAGRSVNRPRPSEPKRGDVN